MKLFTSALLASTLAITACARTQAPSAQTKGADDTADAVADTAPTSAGMFSMTFPADDDRINAMVLETYQAAVNAPKSNALKAAVEALKAEYSDEASVTDPDESDLYLIGGGRSGLAHYGNELLLRITVRYQGSGMIWFQPLMVRVAVRTNLETETTTVVMAELIKTPDDGTEAPVAFRNVYNNTDEDALAGLVLQTYRDAIHAPQPNAVQAAVDALRSEEDGTASIVDPTADDLAYIGGGHSGIAYFGNELLIGISIQRYGSGGIWFRPLLVRAAVDVNLEAGTTTVTLNSLMTLPE